MQMIHNQDKQGLGDMANREKEFLFALSQKKTTLSLNETKLFGEKKL